MAKKNNEEKVYATLMMLCREGGASYNKRTTWPKTRDVADRCDISIYSARLFLIRLEQAGIVICFRNNRGNSLRWHLADINFMYV